MGDFIFVVQQEGNLVQLKSCSQSSLTTVTNILNINPFNNILDEFYDLVAQLETALVKGERARQKGKKKVGGGDRNIISHLIPK